MTTPDPLLAIAARARGGDWAGALADAERALLGQPLAPALLSFAALAALQTGDETRGESYLRRQLAVDPGDRVVATNLATLLARAGRCDQALELARKHAGHPRLARLAGYLNLEAGNHAAAVVDYGIALAAHPEDAESWNNLGNALAALGQSAGAIEAFERAINGGAPGFRVFLNLSSVLGQTDNREGRLSTIREGLSRFPAEPELLLELGLAEAACGNFESAVAALRSAAASEAGIGAATIELGLLYENLNQLENLDSLIAAAEARGDDQPELDFLKAWSLRRQSRFAEADVLAKRIPATINPIRAAQLRAEVADRLDRTDEAFAEFSAMNRAALAAKSAPPGPTYRQTVEAGTAAIFPGPVHALSDRPGDQPVFLVGFPRSGTTLLNTLLSSYEQLQVFEEQPMLANVMAEFPGIAETSDPGLLAAARVRYLDFAEAIGGPRADRRIIDKHPLHMAQMQIIHRLFPMASIVLVERHPCDAVLGSFMANFALNPAMRSFADLEEAARTYDAVFTAWERAEELLPLRLHRVRYERMVADLKGELRPLVAFLGLPWREEVLDNQTSAARRGHVRTASYAQVGQALYSHAVDRWRRYRAHLESVLPILAPWATRMGYAMEDPPADETRLAD